MKSLKWSLLVWISSNPEVKLHQRERRCPSDVERVLAWGRKARTRLSSLLLHATRLVLLLLLLVLCLVSFPSTRKSEMIKLPFSSSIEYQDYYYIYNINTYQFRWGDESQRRKEQRAREPKDNTNRRLDSRCRRCSGHSDLWVRFTSKTRQFQSIHSIALCRLPRKWKTRGNSETSSLQLKLGEREKYNFKEGAHLRNYIS